jgi:hypothetical protein
MRSPGKVMRVLLAFVVGSTIFADYWEYSRAYHGNPDTWMDVIRGEAAAPQQYRIGVPMVADWLRRHGHMGLRHGFALLDLISALVAVYVLFAVFQRLAAYRTATGTARWFGAAAFLFLLQYYFIWITWYQRPETMASAAVLAATLWLLTVRIALPRAASIALASCGMLVLAGLQGFIRADVIFAVHAGVVLVCLTRRGVYFPVGRWVQAAVSVLSVLIAGGIQFYLMRVVYPQATYRQTAVIELGSNLTNPLGMLAFVLFMLPWGWLMLTLIRRRGPVEAAPLGVLAGSAIYVAMWFVVGRIEEVRIFLPFAVALIPLTCATAMRWLAGGVEEGTATS